MDCIDEVSFLIQKKPNDTKNFVIITLQLKNSIELTITFAMHLLRFYNLLLISLKI